MFIYISQSEKAMFLGLQVEQQFIYNELNMG